MLGKEEYKEWRRISRQRFKMDGYKCMRCKTHHNWGKGLTAHHILARRDGGKDFIDNLISLCSVCHDEVEGLQLDAWEITNMSPPPDGREISRPIEDSTPSYHPVTKTKLYVGKTGVPCSWGKGAKWKSEYKYGTVFREIPILAGATLASLVMEPDEDTSHRDNAEYHIIRSLSSICARDEESPLDTKPGLLEKCFRSVNT